MIELSEQTESEQMLKFLGSRGLVILELALPREITSSVLEQMLKLLELGLQVLRPTGASEQPAQPCRRRLLFPLQRPPCFDPCLQAQELAILGLAEANHDTSREGTEVFLGMSR